MDAYVSHECVPPALSRSPSSSSTSSAARPLTTERTESRETREEAGSGSHSVHSDLDPGSGSGSGSSVLSDVHTFTGRIVYNPDGSAYVIEDVDGGSENGDGDGDRDSHLRLPDMEGAIVDRAGAGATSSSSAPIPQIASAVFVPKPSSSLCHAVDGSSAPLCPPQARDGVPSIHSFRVYTLRDSQDGDKRVETDSDAGQNQGPSLLPAKPILMCFVCKLSFGLASTFLTHARLDHQLEVREEEKAILARPKASAIVQGVGKDKTPLMSFLEPLPPSSSSAVAPASSSKPFSYVAPVSTVTSAPTNVKYIYTAPMVSKDVTKSSPAAETSHDACPAPADDRVSENSAVREVSEDKGNGFKQREEKCAEWTEPSVRPPRSQPTMAASVMSLSRSDPMKQEPPAYPLSHDLPQDGASPVSTPVSMFPGPQLVLPALLGGGTCDEHPMGRVPECNKCDLALGSSPVLGGGGHMTLMHSRNSSKTLKCPRCNWHYKYQETLEIHMKEKHPDNDTQCLYCLTNQQHPRLSRGETYSCGYKPYHCAVCNYSTTTKGNLTIHMQSDKHINNMQEFTNGSSASLQDFATSAASVAASVSSVSGSGAPQSQAGKPAGGGGGNGGAEEAAKKSSSKPKQPYRCELCNYETPVARNLRIHNTSEKHTHNVMMVQQNMKSLHMGQLMMDPLFALAGPGALPPGMYPYDQSMMMAAAATAPQFYDLPFPLGRENGALVEEGLVDGAADTNQLYQCVICGLHATDSLESLHLHLTQDRTKQQEADNVSFEGGTYTCLLCQYKTNLKANFQLHCKTDKHLQRLQLTNHIREGGPANEWRLANLPATNPTQVRCNACNFYTSSVHKLQLHASQPPHEGNAMVFRQLQIAVARLQQTAASGSAHGPTKAVSRFYYRCVLCGVNARTKAAMLRHATTARHLHVQQAETSQRGLDPRDFYLAVQLKDGESVVFEDSGECLDS